MSTLNGKVFESIRNFKLLNDTNEIFVNYVPAHLFLYNKDGNLHVLRTVSGAKYTNTNHSSNIEKYFDGDKSKLTEISIGDMERTLSSLVGFQGLKKNLSQFDDFLKANSGIHEIRFVPEMNIINLITSDFVLLEKIFLDEAIFPVDDEEVIEDMKSAYVYRMAQFYIDYTNMFLTKCKSGTGPSSRDLDLQYERMRMLTSFVPVAVSFTHRNDFLYLKNIYGMCLLDYVKSLFGDELVVLDTANVDKKLIKPEDYAGEHGIVLFTTKANVAKFLGIKTDFVDYKTLSRVFISKLFEGFWGVKEKVYGMTRNNAKEEALSNQVCYWKCMGGVSSIEEGSKSSLNLLIVEYLKAYQSRNENTIANDKDKRFGGNVIFYELKNFEELTGKFGTLLGGE